MVCRTHSGQTSQHWTRISIPKQLIALYTNDRKNIPPHCQGHLKRVEYEDMGWSITSIKRLDSRGSPCLVASNNLLYLCVSQLSSVHVLLCWPPHLTPASSDQIFISTTSTTDPQGLVTATHVRPTHIVSHTDTRVYTSLCSLTSFTIPQ